MTLITVYTATQVIYAGVRGLVCALDGIDAIDDKELSQRQKILRIVSDLFALSVQFGGYAAWFVRAAPRIKMALTGADVIADTTQKVVVLSGKEGPIDAGDCVDLGGGIILRVSGLGQSVLGFSPQLFGDHHQTAETIAGIGAFVGTVGVHNQIIQRVYGYSKRVVRWIFRRPPVEAAPNQRVGRRNIRLTPEDAEIIYRLKQMQTIDEIEEIPRLYHTDNVFKQFRCALSGKPIRHMLVITGTEESANPVWFESAAILQKIQQKEKPAQWPENIPFEKENLHDFPAKQREIDNALSEILKDIQASELVFQPIENGENAEYKKYLQMVAILKAIGLGKIGAMQDEEICDLIVARVSPNMISSVYVDTFSHQFHPGMQPKPTKLIRFTPTHTLLPHAPLPEKWLFAATRAALISQDLQDRKALAYTQIPFEIQVSNDLQDLTISSEFAKPAHERKTELLSLMKNVLQTDRLPDLPDEELAERIVATISNGPRFNVSVDSLLHTFAGTSEPKPAKAITFSPPVRRTGRRASSTEKLFATARSLFGSPSDSDKQECKKSDGFTLYVDASFQDIDMVEFPRG